MAPSATYDELIAQQQIKLKSAQRAINDDFEEAYETLRNYQNKIAVTKVDEADRKEQVEQALKKREAELQVKESTVQQCEGEVKGRETSVKKHEETVRAREMAVKEGEEDLKTRDVNLKLREKDAEVWDSVFDDKVKGLTAREVAVEEYEHVLRAREDALATREKEMAARGAKDEDDSTQRLEQAKQALAEKFKARQATATNVAAADEAMKRSIEHEQSRLRQQVQAKHMAEANTATTPKQRWFPEPPGNRKTLVERAASSTNSPRPTLSGIVAAPDFKSSESQKTARQRAVLLPTFQPSAKAAYADQVQTSDEEPAYCANGLRVPPLVTPSASSVSSSEPDTMPRRTGYRPPGLRRG